MALSIRFLMVAGKPTTLQANGRTYAAGSAKYLDVPLPDALAIASDQARRMIWIGTTAERPTAAGVLQPVPEQYYDTSLAAVIWWTGAGYVDSSGNSA
jgi:hypothetical protein